MKKSILTILAVLGMIKIIKARERGKFLKIFQISFGTWDEKPKEGENEEIINKKLRNRSFIANHVDMVLNAPIDIKELNPNLKVLKYLVIQYIYTPFGPEWTRAKREQTEETLKTYIGFYENFDKWRKEKGYSDDEIEEIFLHFKERTTINGKTFPGYAEDKSQSRIIVGDNYWFSNPKSQIYREYLKYQMKIVLDMGFDGFELDHGAFPDYRKFLNPHYKNLSEDEWIKIREYPNDYWTDFRDSQFYDDMIDLYRFLYENIKAPIHPNTAHVINREREEDTTKSAFKEHYLGIRYEPLPIEIKDNELIYYPQWVKERIDYVKKQSKKGVKLILPFDHTLIEFNNGDERIIEGETEKERIDKGIARGRMWALAYYYLMATENTYFGLNFMDWREADSETPYNWRYPDYSIQDHIKDDYGRNYGLEPLYKNWFGALEFDIGWPRGDAYDFNENIMIREYDKAVVIVSLDYDLKTTEIDLSELFPNKKFKRLNVSGELEDIDKIELKHPEGIILIKAGMV